MKVSEYPEIVKNLMKAKPNSYFSLIKSQHPEICSYIKEKFPQLFGKPFSESCYWLAEGLSDYPKCKACGKPLTKFYSLKHGAYGTYCSDKCAVNDKAYIERKASSLSEKYKGDFCNVFQLKPVKDKIMKSMEERHGCEKPLQNPEIFKKMIAKSRQSQPEKKTEEALKNRGFRYVKNWQCNGKNFDFALMNEDGSLNSLIEIDGEYWHGLTSDSDGLNVRGETDAARFEKVPEGVKFICFDSKNIEEGFSEICSSFGLSYHDWLFQVFKSLPDSFPYPAYSDKRMKSDWAKLERYTEIKPSARIGMSIVKNFHKSIWEARKNGQLPPEEAWKDKGLLWKMVKNRWIYSDKLSSQDISNGFTVTKNCGQVSLFSPSLAKDLIFKHLNEFSEVFDPFSGFSGRMLGACSLGKRYIGQDNLQKHIDESEKIKAFLGLSNEEAELSCRDLFDCNSAESHECLFTCPPYSDKEIWSSDASKLRVLSCDEWIDECLARFKCKRYLFIADNTQKYESCIVGEIKNKSHFGCNFEKVIKIQKSQQMTANLQ